MYKATVKHVATGKNDSSALYCESKSGNVYKFRTPVPADRAPTIIAKIKSAKVINTKHWIKLQEGKAPTTPVEKAAAEINALKALVAEQKKEIAELTADLCAF